MGTQEYIEYLIQQQLNNNQQRPFDTLNGYKNTLNNINNLGGNFKTTGDYLSGLNNNFANKLGSGLTKVGDTLQGGVSAVKNIPQNVFKGFAQPTNPAIESALSSTLGTTGIAGEGITASSMAGGTGASAGAGALGGAAAPLIGLGLMAIDGANRKRAKQSGEALLNQTNQMASAVANDTTAQDFANNIIKQSQNNLNQGVITGGASPIEEPENVYQGSILDAQPQANNSALGSVMTPNIGNAIATNDIYNSPTDNNVQTGGIEQTKQGLLSKLISGFGDFAQGYQENRNTGFKPENFDQNKFPEQTTTYTPNQKLVDYQNKLRNDQDFIKWANNAQKDKETVINNIVNGGNGGYGAIDEWIKANPEALKPVANTQTTYTGKEKGKMARLGEGVGTIARALQNPTFQGLVAGGLGAALTGNPLYGLGLGYKFASKRAMSDAYRDVLKQNGVNVPDTGTFGNITNQDLGTIGRLAETRAYHEAMQQRYDLDRELKRLIAENNDRHKDVQDKTRQQIADARTTSANAQMIKANQPKTTGGKGGSGKGAKKNTQTKPQQHPDWNKDLAGYIQRLDDPRYATKIGQLKAGFINKYGVDPDKFIK